jgi:hypothetical protein
MVRATLKSRTVASKARSSLRCSNGSKPSISNERQRVATSRTALPTSSIADPRHLLEHLIATRSTLLRAIRTHNRDPRPPPEYGFRKRVRPPGPHRQRVRLHIHGGTALLLRARLKPEPVPLLLEMLLIPRISSSVYVQSHRRLRDSAGKHDSETRRASPRRPQRPSTTTSLCSPARASSIARKCGTRHGDTYALLRGKVGTIHIYRY